MTEITRVTGRMLAAAIQVETARGDRMTVIRHCPDCEALKRTLDVAHRDWRERLRLASEANTRIGEQRDDARQQLEGAVDRIKTLRGNVDPASGDDRESAYARGYLAAVTDALERLGGQ